MKMHHFLVLVFLITSCSALNYELGKKYRYSYETEVKVDDPSLTKDTIGHSEAGFKLSSNVDLVVAWQNSANKQDQLIQLTVQDVKLSNVSERPEDRNTFANVPRTLQAVSPYSVFFQWNDGRVGSVYANEKDASGSLNVKRGLISLLQIQLADGKVTETDASGECQVTYTAKGNSIEKVKKASTCTTESDVKFYHPKRIMDIDITSEVRAAYQLSADSSLIQSASSFESHLTGINVRKSLASSVVSKQLLTYTSTEEGGKTLPGATIDDALQGDSNLVATSLISEPAKQQCASGCEIPSKVIENLRSKLKGEYMSKTKSAIASIDAVLAFRNAGRDTLLAILRDRRNEEILPQLLDILAATQTLASEQALLELVDFKDEELIESIERLLLVTGYNNHPSEFLLQTYLDMLKNNGVPNAEAKETLALTLGNLLGTYCGIESRCQTKVAVDIREYLLEMVKSDDVPTRCQGLRALGNAALPSLFQVIVDVAANADDADVITTAINVMHVYDEDFFTKDVNDVLNRIYHELRREYTYVIRLTAANTLLTKKPSEQDVIDILFSLSDQKVPEMVRFLTAKIDNLMTLDCVAGQTVRNTLSSAAVSNYNTRAHSGLSAAFTNVMADTADSLASFDQDILFTSTAVLRKSDFSVNLEADNNTLQIANVGIWARGLETFLGEDTGEDAGAAAGLSVKIMDVQLRPMSFSATMSDIMSLVWSMGSDSSMTALQGIILLQDHYEHIRLQSGFDVEVAVQGTVSLKLSGGLDFSLWERSSTTSIYNNGAMAVRGSLKLDTGFLQTGMEYSADADGSITFVTTVLFAELPAKFCMQMMQDPLLFRHRVRKYEELTGSTHKFTVGVNRKALAPPLSFKLYKQNSIQCDEMLGQEEEDSGSWW
ncbi:microsomal triglyceride transfer protein-like [Anneissia japonica]|uniref:microsomal triglyceride transfer protein-like n=1 Tax=Anneissia japonica TaxID=1529436 RepID=UPI001425BB3E|nr:microsomal triglyceride transfer protein-like [Anneissia japonica]